MNIFPVTNLHQACQVLRSGGAVCLDPRYKISPDPVYDAHGNFIGHWPFEHFTVPERTPDSVTAESVTADLDRNPLAEVTGPPPETIGMGNWLNNLKI